MRAILRKNSNLLKQIFFYLTFYLFIWVAHLIVISFVAFFHFLLDHPLNIIKDWVFFRGWEIILISKFLASFGILRFINLRMSSRQPIRDFFIQGFVWPRSEIFILITFFIAFFIIWGGPEVIIRTQLELFRMLLAYLGISFFYMLDLLVLDSLERIYPLQNKKRWVSIVIFPCLLFFISKGIFWYGDRVDFLMFFNFLLCLVLWQWRGRNWLQPLCYVCFFAAPLGVFIGMDPIWGSAFSPIKLTKAIGFEHYLIVLLTALAYLYYRKKWISEVH